MSENLYPARLKQKVTVAPRSQTNRSVFSARLNRAVDKSAERKDMMLSPKGEGSGPRDQICRSEKREIWLRTGMDLEN